MTHYNASKQLEHNEKFSYETHLKNTLKLDDSKEVIQNGLRLTIICRCKNDKPQKR